MELSKRNIRKLGDSIAERIIDIVLLGFYFNLEAPDLVRGKRYLIGSKIQNDLEILDYQKIKRALYFLKRKGLINYVQGKDILPQITKAGELRLRKVIPHYDEKRIWDGQIYLISYDFPKDKNNERDSLRKYLKNIGCGMLQQSNWLIPYNPTNLIQEFIKKHDLSNELILISSIGKNGAIGALTINELMLNVYSLDKLNLRYSEFIFKYKSKSERKEELIFLFLSILNNDPQIPFSLLPEDWLGEEAYVLFKKIKQNQRQVLTNN